MGGAFKTVLILQRRPTPVCDGPLFSHVLPHQQRGHATPFGSQPLPQRVALVMVHYRHRRRSAICLAPQAATLVSGEVLVGRKLPGTSLARPHGHAQRGSQPAPRRVLEPQRYTSGLVQTLYCFGSEKYTFKMIPIEFCCVFGAFPVLFSCS